MPPPMRAATVIRPSETADRTKTSTVALGGTRCVRRHRHNPNHATAPVSSRHDEREQRRILVRVDRLPGTFPAIF